MLVVIWFCRFLLQHFSKVMHFMKPCPPKYLSFFERSPFLSSRIIRVDSVLCPSFPSSLHLFSVHAFSMYHMCQFLPNSFFRLLLPCDHQIGIRTPFDISVCEQAHISNLININRYLKQSKQVSCLPPSHTWVIP